jgi:hypothetical protein
MASMLVLRQVRTPTGTSPLRPRVQGPGLGHGGRPDHELPPPPPLHEDHLVAHLQARCRIDTKPPEERPTVQGAGGSPQRLVVGTGLLQATLGDETGGVGLGGRVVGWSALGPDALGGLVRAGPEVGEVVETRLPLARPQEPLGTSCSDPRSLAGIRQADNVRAPRRAQPYLYGVSVAEHGALDCTH